MNWRTCQSAITTTTIVITTVKQVDRQGQQQRNTLSAACQRTERARRKLLPSPKNESNNNNQNNNNNSFIRDAESAGSRERARANVHTRERKRSILECLAANPFPMRLAYFFGCGFGLLLLCSHFYSHQRSRRAAFSASGRCCALIFTLSSAAV